LRRLGGLIAAMLVTATAFATAATAPAPAEADAHWCSALAYLLDDTPQHGVTVTVTCSAVVRELRISIPSARRLAGTTAKTTSRRRSCKPAGTTAVCRLRLPAEAGIALVAIATPAPRLGQVVVFGATFANGTQNRLRLTITGPPGDDG
jgi:hypothetical protein